MKKLIALFLVAVMCLSFAACDNSSNDAKETGTETASKIESLQSQLAEQESVNNELQSQIDEYQRREALLIATGEMSDPETSSSPSSATNSSEQFSSPSGSKAYNSSKNSSTKSSSPKCTYEYLDGSVCGKACTKYDGLCNAHFEELYSIYQSLGGTKVPKY